MNLTPQQSVEVQVTFHKLLPLSESFISIFYGRLFELDPDSRSMFSISIKEQGLKLMQTLSIIVASLDMFDKVVPSIQSMGRRHVHYGVDLSQYSTMREALLWALEQQLGASFTSDAKSGWAIVYDTLAQSMLEAT